MFAIAGVNLVPHVGESLHMVLKKLFARRRESATELISGIATASGGPENLAPRLAIPEIEAFFIDGFETAMRTGVSVERRLLAEVVANAIAYDAKVDSSQLYIIALRNLEASHIRARARLARIMRVCHREVLAFSDPGQRQGVLAWRRALEQDG